MKKLGPLSRAMAVLGIAMAGGFVAPALSAQADIDALKKYVGSYRGAGVFEGAQSERVQCTLTLAERGTDKVGFNGRCTVAGSRLSITGTMAFINNRYEAVITSNAAFSGKAIGRRQGENVLFEFRDSGKDEEGREMDLSADFALQGGKISVRFNVTTADGTYRATVPFTK